ncbi:MAG TPA: ABC transporter permease [Pyrinomonadaceae bacterium]|jgi:predicted permease
MTLLRWLASFWRNLFHKARLNEELDEEIRAYAEMLIEEKIERGMDAAEARRAALIEVGGIEQVKDQVRDVRVGVVMEILLQDLRYGARMLWKKPGFTLTAVITLGLGIGATTAIFSIVDAVLLRPLPYTDAARIVELKEVSAKGTRMPVTEPNYEDVRARNHSFEAIAEYSGGSASTMMTTIIGGSEPVRAPVYAVSGEFFRVLGVAPIVGRTFLPEELQSGTPLAIVSYGFWQRQLGGRADLTGTVLRIDNQSLPVVGVLPPNLGFPKAAEVWVPREMYRRDASRTAHNWSVIARLRPDVMLDTARADLSAIGQQLKQENGAGTDAIDFALIPLQEYLVGNARQALLIILAAVGFLLLVAGTNVANLLLAQMTVRQKEFAVRAALGAGRLRLAQQFLTENLLLALIGGAFGVLFSFWGVDLILRLNQGSLPRADEISVNGRALVFTLVLSAFIAIALGVVSVLHVGSRDLQAGLKEAARGQTAHSAGKRLRGLLVIAQVALTLILLVGAGLLGKSFVELLRVDPGFRPESAVVMNLSLPASHDKEQKKRSALFYQQLLERLGQLPGVVAVGGVNGLPLTDTGGDGTFLIDNDPSHTGHAEYRLASSGYFAAMGIPLLRGRMFGASDGENAPPAAVISQSLAQKYFPGADPIGKRIQFGNMDGDARLLEIVGVVDDVREGGLDRPPALTVYANAFQRPQAYTLWVVVRAQGYPATLIPLMRQAAQSLNPEIPTTFRTLTEVYSSSLDARRFSLVIFGVFASVALILAMLGLYGVISYAVAQRTQEIGIRLALGAQGRDVLRLILRQGMTLTLCGVVLGLIASFALTRLMASLLYGVTAHDPLTFAGVTLLLATVALIACLIPARRATKVDPIIALRYE